MKLPLYDLFSALEILIASWQLSESFETLTSLAEKKSRRKTAENVQSILVELKSF